MTDEEVGPREHGVVDGTLLGRHRLAVDDSEDSDPAAVEVVRRVG
jgi:hypothetical protein